MGRYLAKRRKKKIRAVGLKSRVKTVTDIVHAWTDGHV
jgi:hypothetical protein